MPPGPGGDERQAQRVVRQGPDGGLPQHGGHDGQQEAEVGGGHAGGRAEEGGGEEQLLLLREGQCGVAGEGWKPGTPWGSGGVTGVRHDWCGRSVLPVGTSGLVDILLLYCIQLLFQHFLLGVGLV